MTALLVAGLAVVQIAVATRWFAGRAVPGDHANGLQAALGPVIGAGSGIAAGIAVAQADDERPLGPAAAVLGLAVLAGLLQQLVRRDGRAHLTESLSATVTLSAVAVLGAGHVAAQRGDGGMPVVAAALFGAVAAVVVGWIPVPGMAATWAEPVRALTALALAVAVGAVTSTVSSLAAAAAVLSALAGGVAGLVGLLFARRMVRPDVVLVAGLPLLLSGPAAFLLGRLMVS